MDYNAKIVMLKGADGADIKDISKTATKTLVDTYTVTLSDGRKYIFNVTNGKAIKNVSKTATSGLTDTYTIAFNDGSTQTFNVTNGVGFKSIEKTATSGLTDTYTLTLTDGSTEAIPVTNGRGIKNISKTGSEGLVDTYTTTYNDGTTSTFTVTNGEGVDDVRGQIHTNLLNPTAPTQTINGVTFTNNGDGTYTVNGTANDRCAFRVGNVKVKKDQYAKITGCPKNGSGDTYYLAGTNNVDYDLGSDIGSGHIFHNTSNYTEFYTYIIIGIGTTCNNLLFKPMLTTDLNATYDDFVPYTGDSGRLNEDVSNLVKDMSAVLEKVYPVGSIYMSAVNTSPATLFGGTWEQIQGRFLLGDDSTYYVWKRTA